MRKRNYASEKYSYSHMIYPLYFLYFGSFAPRKITGARRVKNRWYDKGSITAGLKVLVISYELLQPSTVIKVKMEDSDIHSVASSAPSTAIMEEDHAPMSLHAANDSPRIRKGSFASSRRSSVSFNPQSYAIGRSLSRKLTSLRYAVQDDNEQTDAASKDLNDVLEDNFDLEDAIRMRTNTGVEQPVRVYDEDDVASSVDNNSTEGQPTIAKVFTNKSTGNLDLPPDGGYGWVCCLCVTLVMFATWGANSGFGVFLAFYLNNAVFAGGSKYQYALIAGFSIFFGQGLPPLVLVLMRIFGLKFPMYLGITILFAGLLMASFAVDLWQLYLTQGVLFGMGISLIYAPATTVLPGWFLKKRSFAMGISLIGTGAGGVTYSLAVNKLIQDTGNQKWALRMMAITCSVTCIVAALLIKQRTPVEPAGVKSWKRIKEQFAMIFSIRVMKLYSVNLIAIWFALALFGYNLMVFTLSPYAVARGLTAHQSSLLTAILNAAQSVGRPVMGLMGDKFGRTNTTVGLTTLLTIFLFAFWLPCHTFIQLIFFSICVGSCVGVANVMNTVLVADIVGPVDFLPAWGYVNSVGAPILLVSELIAQALTDESNPSNPYLHTQIFAGLCFFCALLLVLLLRELTVRIKLTERQKITHEKLMEKENDTDKEDEDDINWTVLSERQAKYDYLLGPGVKKFFRRMFYPMKV
ncbi:LAFE_0F05842g1_1 [Lachancea fermentati]|uniref:LAFE_0F05842g1_1 n=1 Tax=Lachancea fermentati TaxID=4955 RepID=A0A1G4MF50_LACFM|nr:LAFE_0F05842g1_1 [Lachancea fermentati]